jgi:hypothetical protein
MPTQQKQKNEPSTISKWIKILKPMSNEIADKMKVMIKKLTDDGDDDDDDDPDRPQAELLDIDKVRKSLIKDISNFKVNYDKFLKEIKEELLKFVIKKEVENALASQKKKILEMFILKLIARVVLE